MKKRLQCTCLILVLMMSLVSCQNQSQTQSITGDIYQSKLQSMGYEVTHIPTGHPRVKDSYFFENDTLHIEFHEIENVDYAKESFDSYKTTVLSSYKDDTSTESYENKEAYQKYSLKTSDSYYIITQVDATFLNASCQISDSDELDKIIKNLSY